MQVHCVNYLFACIFHYYRSQRERGGERERERIRACVRTNVRSGRGLQENHEIT
jgi:hypothetical protein